VTEAVDTRCTTARISVPPDSEPKNMLQLPESLIQ
jgi:hypothetical protein